MNSTIVVGMLEKGGMYTLEMSRRVYSIEGICPTLNTCGGGGTQPKILTYGEDITNDM